MYFTKKRAIATGIATSGSGLGVIVYPYLTESLISLYDWRNTLLIIAGLCLNATVCGALFRPLSKQKGKSSPCDCLDENKSEFSEAGEKQSMLAEAYDSRIYVDKICSDKMYNSTSNIHTKPITIVDQLKVSDRHYYSDQNIPMLQVPKRRSDFSDLMSPNRRSDIFYSGSISKLPDQRSSMVINDKQDDKLEDCDVTSDLTCTSICQNNANLIRSCISMLRQPSFLLLLFCMIMWTGMI